MEMLHYCMNTGQGALKRMEFITTCCLTLLTKRCIELTFTGMTIHFLTNCVVTSLIKMT